METKEYLSQLNSCTTEQGFKNFWNPDKFDWGYSYLLCRYCNKYFDFWWDTDKFIWKYHSDYLCLYCNKYFNVWWDPNKFNWRNIKYLQKYCQDYKHIWEKDYIKWKLKNT